MEFEERTRKKMMSERPIVEMKEKNEQKVIKRCEEKSVEEKDKREGNV